MCRNSAFWEGKASPTEHAYRIGILPRTPAATQKCSSSLLQRKSWRTRGGSSLFILSARPVTRGGSGGGARVAWRQIRGSAWESRQQLRAREARQQLRAPADLDGAGGSSAAGGSRRPGSSSTAVGSRRSGWPRAGPYGGGGRAGAGTRGQGRRGEDGRGGAAAHKGLQKRRRGAAYPASASSSPSSAVPGRLLPWRLPPAGRRRTARPAAPREPTRRPGSPPRRRRR